MFYSIFTPGFVPFRPFLALLLLEMVSIMSQHNLVTVSHPFDGRSVQLLSKNSILGNFGGQNGGFMAREC